MALPPTHLCINDRGLSAYILPTFSISVSLGELDSTDRARPVVSRFSYVRRNSAFDFKRTFSPPASLHRMCGCAQIHHIALARTSGRSARRNAWRYSTGAFGVSALLLHLSVIETSALLTVRMRGRRTRRFFSRSLRRAESLRAIPATHPSRHCGKSYATRQSYIARQTTPCGAPRPTLQACRWSFLSIRSAD